MPFTYTPNYNLAKPEDNTYDWGDDINANFDIIDTALKTLSDLITNHSRHTGNPHQTTYVQVGAAAAVHTHTGSDITSPVLEAVLADKVDNIHFRTQDNTLQYSEDGYNWSTLGLGDMLKDVYDTNNDGIVDNAEKVGGYSPSTTAAANTVAVRDTSGDLTARVLKSSVSTGTAPVQVLSTTVCTNLNADKVDGYDVGNSSGQIPVSNGALCTNLNSDKVDGYDASAFFLLGNTNQSINLFRALNQRIDTRRLDLVYNTNGNLTTVYEKDGETTVKTTTLGYDSNGNLSTITEQVGGRTITTTLSYDTNGNLRSITRQVS
jgi:YD repeat-containing protein